MADGEDIEIDVPPTYYDLFCEKYDEFASRITRFVDGDAPVVACTFPCWRAFLGETQMLSLLTPEFCAAAMPLLAAFVKEPTCEAATNALCANEWASQFIHVDYAQLESLLDEAVDVAILMHDMCDLYTCFAEHEQREQPPTH